MGDKMLDFNYFDQFFPYNFPTILRNKKFKCFHTRVNINAWKCLAF